MLRGRAWHAPGDGATNTVVFEQPDGSWFVVGSSAGFFTPALSFGDTNFLPVVSPYK